MQRKLLPSTGPFDQQFNQNKIGRSLLRELLLSTYCRAGEDNQPSHAPRRDWFPTAHSRLVLYCTFSAGSLPDWLLRRYSELNRSSIVEELQTALCLSTRL